MTVTCVLTYIIALIPLKCFSMPHDESKLLNTVDNVELEKPSTFEFKDVIIVNEKKNSRDFWANYLARFEKSKGRGQEKRGRDMPCYLSGFSFRERQSYERKIKSEILLKLKKNKMFKVTLKCFSPVLKIEENEDRSACFLHHQLHTKYTRS